MLNGDIESGFEVEEESEPTLRIQNQGVVNRPVMTRQDLSTTAYKAKLVRVQYGTWSGKEAVLLCFDFTFRFPNDDWKRLVKATIRLTLEETANSQFADPVPRNPLNDPHIVLIAPAQVCGELKSETRSHGWKLSVPLKFSQFGAEAGIEAEYGESVEGQAERRLWLTGHTDGDDLHHEENAVVWSIKENEVQRSGILHRFPTALVACLPSGPAHPLKLKAQVTPVVAHSINPLRLLQKRDEPIYLDRSTPRGDPVASGMDFKDPNFPWEEVIVIPKEYSVCSPSQVFTTSMIDA